MPMSSFAAPVACLPSGFQRIRHYGLLANRCRAVKLARCRQLLDAPAPAVKLPDAALDYRDRYEQLTGKSLRDCPKCGQGHMICIETFLPGTCARASGSVLMNAHIITL